MNERTYTFCQKFCRLRLSFPRDPRIREEESIVNKKILDPRLRGDDSNETTLAQPTICLANRINKNS